MEIRTYPEEALQIAETRRERCARILEKAAAELRTRYMMDSADHANGKDEDAAQREQEDLHIRLSYVEATLKNDIHPVELEAWSLQ